ncbi:unnamed protein product [Fraxinus pennsylvanica]|uniref:Apyrase n=1 Tax=Fraxinus pennsylvanica TaxID=56036 RepID=A0AAD1Z643_9LAMI|nr:unnamed protein product [Fraxinus pennsylvanica]
MVSCGPFSEEGLFLGLDKFELTGTRIHVFKYEVRSGNLVPDFMEKGLVSMKVNSGLSADAEEPERAGAAVTELVEFTKKNVPREGQGEAEIRYFQLLTSNSSIAQGSDEGLYAWVVSNYALGTLGGDPAKTTGIIELGGASAQITFFSNEPMPLSTLEQLNLFGQNVALELLKESLVSRGQETGVH